MPDLGGADPELEEERAVDEPDPVPSSDDVPDSMKDDDATSGGVKRKIETSNTAGKARIILFGC